MNFFKRVFVLLQNKYHRSLVNEWEETQRDRQKFIKQRISELEEGIFGFNEVYEENPYGLQAFTLFSEASNKNKYTRADIRRSFFRVQSAFHQTVAQNVHHYRTSVPTELMNSYFRQWQTLSELHEALEGREEGNAEDTR